MLPGNENSRIADLSVLRRHQNIMWNIGFERRRVNFMDVNSKSLWMVSKNLTIGKDSCFRGERKNTINKLSLALTVIESMNNLSREGRLLVSIFLLHSDDQANDRGPRSVKTERPTCFFILCYMIKITRSGMEWIMKIHLILPQLIELDFQSKKSDSAHSKRSEIFFCC
jgi:hypothetical protein